MWGAQLEKQSLYVFQIHPQTLYEAKTIQNCDFGKRELPLTHIHMKMNSDKGRIRKL
jgi:hypothetical protein